MWFCSQCRRKRQAGTRYSCIWNGETFLFVVVWWITQVNWRVSWSPELWKWEIFSPLSVSSSPGIFIWVTLHLLQLQISCNLALIMSLFFMGIILGWRGIPESFVVRPEAEVAVKSQHWGETEKQKMDEVWSQFFLYMGIRKPLLRSHRRRRSGISKTKGHEEITSSGIKKRSGKGCQIYILEM